MTDVEQLQQRIIKLEQKLREMAQISEVSLCPICFNERDFKIRIADIQCNKCNILTCSLHSIGYQHVDKTVDCYCIHCYELLYGD